MGEVTNLFIQGGELAIPERVPFRLTADMIDGLGSFGVEGVFKRCCEQTLRLLREKSDLILAVLEVFKHDPLQRWYVIHSVSMAMILSDTPQSQESGL
jgi:ataxia telangiectasia mutated family protein